MLVLVFNSRLQYYKTELLTTIVQRSSSILNVPISMEAAIEIAGRSRGTPRIANALLRRVRDFAQIKGNGNIDIEIAKFALEALNVDAHGLDEMDNKILSTIIEKFKGGPVGITTLATAVCESAETIEEVYEPFLIQQGFIMRTPRGREVTEQAYKHLGKIKGTNARRIILDTICYSERVSECHIVMVNNKTKYTELIKTEAKRLGFLSCGISKAEFLEEEAPRLENWLKKNMHGEMRYMENHFDKRLDPTLLVEDSKSVVSLLLNYYPSEFQNEDAYKISKYAYGTDYHFVIKDKLKALLHFIQEEIGEVHGRAFVDSAPVLDKAWAAKSGLGWIGKHCNLLTQQVGSFYFIAELIIDLELEYDTPVNRSLWYVYGMH